MYRAGIAGATGYTGIELVQLIHRHPQMEVAWVTSESSVGKPLSEVHAVPFDYPLISLEELLVKLQRDPRHRRLRVLSRTAIAERSFPRWRMKRIGESGDGAAELEDALLAEGRGHSLPDPVGAFLRMPLAA